MKWANLYRVYSGLLRRSCLFIERRLTRMDVSTAIVSFTFDDVYASACSVGTSLLAERGKKGTFYVSMALCGASCANGRYFTEEQLAGLYAAGHEIGNHTYSHIPCRGRRETTLKDIRSNEEALSRRLPGCRIDNFSFPFGHVQPGVRRSLETRFVSLRSIEPGLNAGKIDLNMLRANSLYSSSRGPDDILTMIEEAAKRHAWLIFYTHDVSPHPSAMGCTAELLAHALDRAIASGCHVLPIAAALQAMGVPKRQARA